MPIKSILSILLVILSGGAALSWEVLWQLKATLALGLSDSGTAISLMVIMGGMSLGSLVMGRTLRQCSLALALRLYGGLEVIIGLCGFGLSSTFTFLSQLDTWVYAQAPVLAPCIYLLAMVVALALPALCMGATFPVYTLMAKHKGQSANRFYGFNTLGAALGLLLTALVLIPWLGIQKSIFAVASLNLVVGVSACGLSYFKDASSVFEDAPVAFNLGITNPDLWLVFVTGFATFTLEVSWLRALATVYPNTTDIFAMMLACILVALVLATKKIPSLKAKQKKLSTQVIIAGALILMTTPLIERFDLLFLLPKILLQHLPTPAITLPHVDYAWMLNPLTLGPSFAATAGYWINMLIIFFLISVLIGLTIRYLGLAFAWIIDEPRSAADLGKLYAVNALAAIIGASLAAWVLLPTIGFAKTAWVAGMLVMFTGLWLASLSERILGAVACAFLLVGVIYFDAGIGHTRVQALYANLEAKPAKVLNYIEGPGATFAAIEYSDGARALLINSSSAAGEPGKVFRPQVHYMAWMGHLPMLLHPDPKAVLVLGFGTGQTANAVYAEHAQVLDIVDLHSQVYQLASYFRSNQGVLAKPNVNALTIDGRAYLRRVAKSYEVITLEPMPPITIGVNALYSKEFYELARSRLSAQGVLAQWLPFQTLAPLYAASIAKTFQAVFPNAVLWIDPLSHDGILLGSKDDGLDFGSKWPGFERVMITRNMTLPEVQQSLVFGAQDLARYSALGQIITDDNQLLAYGKALYAQASFLEENRKLLHKFNSKMHPIAA